MIEIGKGPHGVKVGFDLDILMRSHLLVTCNSGGGKSRTLRRIAEQLSGTVQTFIIDPEGEFASLREHFPFVLVGKGGDVPADVRSAGLLAHKLLELGTSAVCDLYELRPEQRVAWLAAFFDAMVDAPKGALERRGLSAGRGPDVRARGQGGGRGLVGGSNGDARAQTRVHAGRVHATAVRLQEDGGRAAAECHGGAHLHQEIRSDDFGDYALMLPTGVAVRYEMEWPPSKKRPVLYTTVGGYEFVKAVEAWMRFRWPPRQGGA